MTKQTLAVKIARKSSLVQPYAKNGNLDTQAASYDWWVCLNGKAVECFRTLKTAKEAAASYGESKPEVLR